MLDALLETIGTLGILASLATKFRELPADVLTCSSAMAARMSMQSTMTTSFGNSIWSILRIQETVTVSSFDRIEAVLYAYLNNEQVAALDFIKSAHGICVNVVFVKPEFRRRGIGSALVQHLITQYPGLKITCPSQYAGSDASRPTA
jgi:GNAT superfamily N-acetyltransferase